MKQLFLGLTALISMTAFSQKEELKTLKKLYGKETLTTEELKEYKEASDKLNSNAASESDKVYAKLFKTIYPALEYESKGVNAKFHPLLFRSVLKISSKVFSLKGLKINNPS